MLGRFFVQNPTGFCFFADSNWKCNESMLRSCLILKRLWCSGFKPGYQTLNAFANSSPGFALKPWE